MPATEYLILADNIKIAYNRNMGNASAIDEPTVIFCGGFRSNMDGSKALWFEKAASELGISYIRFDYQGHGKSSGNFADFSLKDWIGDCLHIIDELTNGPVILIGSSMGGWVAARAAELRPEIVIKYIGIAAAPDFSRDFYWESMSDLDKEKLSLGQSILVPSEYDEDYEISPNLIFGSDSEMILRRPFQLQSEVNLFQGGADTVVDAGLAMRFYQHIDAPRVTLSFVKDGDHSFSRPSDLRIVWDAVKSAYKNGM